MVRKIILINSAIVALGEKYVKTVNYSCYPPLGIITIATRLKKKNPGIDVKILDAEIIGIDKIEMIIKKFKPDLVGISVLTPTYETGLKIAEFAKNNNVSYVVLGNDHASFFPELILKNRDYIDFIISGDNGEIDFCNLVDAINQNKDPYIITNNLSGRKNKNIYSSIKVSIPLSNRMQSLSDLPDFNLLDVEHKNTYIENYNRDFGFYHTKQIIPITINNAAGCNNFKKHCLYCSIYDLKPQWGNPELFWQAVKRYNSEDSVNLFFEVCDNFGGMHKYRKELLKLMPTWFDNSDIELIVYSRAFDIFYNPATLEDFKKLHVRRVIIGLEAGNDFAIHQMRKGHPPGKEMEINRFAIEKLAEANIQLHSSFIYGTLGETYESLEATKQFIYWLKQFENVASIEVSPLYPLPTSPSWELLLGTKPSKFYGDNMEDILKKIGLNDYKKCWELSRNLFANTDIIDNKLASQLWLEYFTNIGYEQITKEVVFINKEIQSGTHINIGAFL